MCGCLPAMQQHSAVSWKLILLSVLTGKFIHYFVISFRNLLHIFSYLFKCFIFVAVFFIMVSLLTTGILKSQLRLPGD